MLGDGGWFVVNANKTGDSLSSTDSNPGIVGDDHLDKNITGESFFLSFDLFAATNNHFALDGDDGLENFVG